MKLSEALSEAIRENLRRFDPTLEIPAGFDWDAFYQEMAIELRDRAEKHSPLPTIEEAKLIWVEVAKRCLHNKHENRRNP